MRVNCNFLPLEHRAFMLEKKVLAASVAFWVFSVVMWTSVFANQTKEASKLGTKIKEQQREQGQDLAERAATQFPQDQIQRLNDRYLFIHKAMGANDFPWMRFYHALDRCLASGDGGRKASIVSLKRCGEKCWTLEGECEDWKDSTRFEEQMIASASGNKKNFADVRLLNYRSVDKGYRFTVQFNFND
jgi:hypothetical protein